MRIIFLRYRGVVNPIFTVLVAVILAFCAFESQGWTITVLVGVSFVSWVLMRRLQSFPKTLACSISFILLIPLFAFLPSFIDPFSYYRESFLQQNFQLPYSITYQPWVTLEDWTMLVASLIWAVNCFEADLSTRLRGRLFALYTICMAAVAVDTILVRVHLWENTSLSVGQFSSRNSTGDLLMFGAVLAVHLALEDFRKARWLFSPEALGWSALSLLYMAALIVNGSRAPFVLFWIGLIPAIRWHWVSAGRGALALTLLLLFGFPGMILLGLAGGMLVGHFRTGIVEYDGRLAVFGDALIILEHAPLFGVGLGNFEGVFNSHRYFTDGSIYRCLFPESDWFWVADEMGVPGLLALGFLVWSLYKTYFHERTTWMAQASFSIALVLFFHSFVDMSGHQPGVIWNALFLMGLGASRRKGPELRIPVAAWLGVGAFLAVVLLLRIQSASLTPWIPTSASFDTAQFAVIHQFPAQRRPAIQQYEMLTKVMGWEPLNWLIYHQRGITALKIPELSYRAESDFRRALFMEQDADDFYQQIDLVCRLTDSPEAREVRRQLLRTLAKRRPVLFQLLYDPGLDEQNEKGLSKLADGSTAAECAAVIGRTGADIDLWRQRYLDVHPHLETVPPELARQLFEAWQVRGNKDELIQKWALHPEWHALGWRSYAYALAEKFEYNQAVATVLLCVKKPKTLHFGAEDLEVAKSDFDHSPDDPYAGLELYFAESQHAEPKQALETLAEVAQLPNAPPYAVYHLGELLHENGNDKEAWIRLSRLLNP